MFSQIQNVVTSRDLFSSNPCRDFWDSQQFSQAASGSQNSQQSSVELFSQSKCSQSQKITTSNDWRANAVSSQQMNEDEPVKYYMKYLSKPPIFPNQSRKDQEKPQIENLEEFIEKQKNKTLERDHRDLLDTFIGLLKDYTKEIKTAMNSFETSLDASLATSKTTLEKMSSVAEKSFTVVDELRKDFDIRFNRLKNELQEKEELKSVISKNEQDLAKLGVEIQLQNKKLEDFRRREEEAFKREEKYKQREEQLLERIKEAERQVVFRDTPPSSQHHDKSVLQGNGRNLVEPKVVVSNPCFTRKDNMVSSYQHMSYCSSHHAPYGNELAGKQYTNNTVTSIQSATATTFLPSQTKCHGKNVENTGSTSSSTCHDCYSLSSAAHCSVIRTADKMQNNSDVSASIHPLSIAPSSSASMIPVQKSESPLQCLPLKERYSAEVRQKKSSTSFPITVVSPTVRVPVPQARDEPDEQPMTKAPSPANRISVLPKDRWSKSRQSPVATVLPQVQVKKQVTNHDQCSNQDKKQEDPLGIFTFDLTASPSFENCRQDVMSVIKRENRKEGLPVKKQSSNPKKRKKKVAEKPRKYSTRSRGMIEESSDNSNEEAVTKASSTSSKSSSVSDTSSSKILAGLKNKVYNAVAANSRKKCDIGIRALTKADAKEFGMNGNKRLQYAQTVSEEISGSSFKRQRLEKRALNLAGSSLFESVDEDISIQQITESIRKHVQKKKLTKQTS